jgi:hypothetical protein
MADLTAYAYKLNPRLRQDACLFSCIQFRNSFAQRLSVIKPAKGPRESNFLLIDVATGLPLDTRMFGQLI